MYIYIYIHIYIYTYINIPSEIKKLLRAFDRWANTARWSLGGSNSLETNQGVQREAGTQTSKLEANFGRGFDSMGKHLGEPNILWAIQLTLNAVQ